MVPIPISGSVMKIQRFPYRFQSWFWKSNDTDSSLGFGGLPIPDVCRHSHFLKVPVVCSKSEKLISGEKKTWKRNDNSTECFVVCLRNIPEENVPFFLRIGAEQSGG